MDSGIFIRTATADDAKALLEIYAPYVLETAISFEYEVPSLEEFAGRISKTLEKYPYLVAERDGEIIGYCYAGAFNARAAYDWSVETTVYVKRDKRRSGVGRALYEALEEALRAMGILNMNACIAYVDEDDDYLTGDSVAYHSKMGFSMVGRFHACGYKFGRWYDMVWMEKLIGEHVGSQPKPRRFCEIG